MSQHSSRPSRTLDTLHTPEPTGPSHDDHPAVLFGLWSSWRAFALADVIHEESRGTIDALHAMDIEVAMLTGDSEDVAKAVAEELGIDQYFAESCPRRKLIGSVSHTSSPVTRRMESPPMNGFVSGERLEQIKQPLERSARFVHTLMDNSQPVLQRNEETRL